MVPTIPASVSHANARWYEATFDVDGKSVRVQYLSDFELTNGRIADMVARGQDYGRVWVDGRAQGTAARIADAAEAIRGAGEPTETRVAARASAEDERRFTSLRTGQALAPVAGRVGEELVEAGERIASAIGIPVRTERSVGEEMERAASLQRGGRTRRAEPVTETARGETARVVSAAEEVTLPETTVPAETAAPAQPAERRGQATYVTTPHYTMRGSQGVAYEFEVVYDSSRQGVGIPAVDQYGYVNASFFDRSENREGIVRYRYRRSGEEGAEWGEWQAPGAHGEEYHKDLMKLSRTPIRYEVRDAEGVVARFNLYIDPEVAQRIYGTKNEDEARRKIIELLASAEDPLKFLRELQEKGLIAGFSTQSRSEGEVIWVRGTINNFIAALERTYGRDASSLGFTQA